MHRILATILAVIAVGAVATAAPAQVTEWTHRGRDAERNAVAASADAPSLATTRWIGDPGGRTLVGQSAPVVAGGRVFVYADTDNGTDVITELVAFDAATGERLWATVMPDRRQDSWAAPTADPERGQVLMPSGTSVTALDAETGAVNWQTPLGADPVANGTVLVAGGRAFVCDYGPFGGATLWCLNLVEGFDGHAAGDVLWTRDIGESVGSEAALIPGNPPSLVVTDEGGALRQFSLDGDNGWTFADIDAHFAGGCTVAGGRIYAATYEYYQTGDNSLLFCVDALTGEELWRAPCERSDSLPVVTGSLVLLSAGLDMGIYGSSKKLQAFDRTSGVKLWETTEAGGWTQVPVAVGHTLYAPVLPPTLSNTVPCDELVAIDLDLTPADPGFIVERYSGAGGSPALADGTLYTLGSAGLHAIGAAPLELDAAGDAWVYANAPQTTGGRHRAVIILSVLDDPNGNTSYTATASIAPGSDGLATVEPTADPLVWHVVGGPEADDPAGEVRVVFDVLGADSGGQGACEATVTVRPLGDFNGDGTADAADKADINDLLNGLPTNRTTRELDLTGDRAADARDKSVINDILNGLPIR